MLKQGLCIWINGLAGSGKSTIARDLYVKLDLNNLVYIDGDEFREIFGQIQKYDKRSRIEVAKQKANLCKVLTSQGLHVICTGISLFAENYKYNRENIKNYMEIYVYCNFEELKRRDQKKLYSQVLSGNIKNVVGVDIAYDKPNPDLVVDNSFKKDYENNIKKIVLYAKDVII